MCHRSALAVKPQSLNLPVFLNFYCGYAFFESVLFIQPYFTQNRYRYFFELQIYLNYTDWKPETAVARYHPVCRHFFLSLEGFDYPGLAFFWWRVKGVVWGLQGKIRNTQKAPRIPKGRSKVSLVLLPSNYHEGSRKRQPDLKAESKGSSTSCRCIGKKSGWLTVRELHYTAAMWNVRCTIHDRPTVGSRSGALGKRLREEAKKER